MDNPLFSLFYRGGAALAIGLLIGLQREHAQEDDEELFGGTRTFALFGLTGFLAAFTSEELGTPLLFAAVVLVIGGLLAVAYFASTRRHQIGLTTETAAVVTLLTGGLCYWDHLGIAAAIGVVTMTLLAIKVQTRSLAKRLTREDIYATVKFAVITLIILPVLPNEGYGPEPFNVLNPYKIWLMVVLISGINFLGYVLIKLVGPQRGVGLTGVLGGLASSTAVTLSFAQRSREVSSLSRAFALAILMAWGIMFGRVLVEVAVVNRPLLGTLWIPITSAGFVTLGYALYLYFTSETKPQEEADDFSNPFELRSALAFGALYAVILVVVRTAQMYFGDVGVYASSILSGLADVDAITLSMAELSQNPDQLGYGTATRAIVLAAVSNTLVKAALVFSTGSPGLRKAILPGVILPSAVALGLMFLA